MKTIFAFVIIVIAAITLSACNKLPPEQAETQNRQTAKASPVPDQNEAANIKATFTIVTNGLTRNFSAKMYHNLSLDVFIESTDPSQVIVKKKGVAWDDFFKTLPMQLTKDCLTTGTKEKFCTGENGTLRFYLNDKEDPGLLDKEIKEGDQALIQFSS